MPQKQVVIKELKEAQSLAQPLIRAHHTHLVNARILYLLTNQPMKRQDRVIAGKAQKNSPLLRFLSSYKDADLPGVLGGYDFIIMFQEQEWSWAKPERKAALVDHELSHAVERVKVSKKTGEETRTWAVAAHDVEEFYGVIERHGLQWQPDVAHLGEVVAKQLGMPGVRSDRDIHEAAAG